MKTSRTFAGMLVQTLIPVANTVLTTVAAVGSILSLVTQFASQSMVSLIVAIRER